MADLRDSLLRALAAHFDGGRGLAVIAGGMPWQCCAGALTDGPAACTCWQPVYDLDQTDPDELTIAQLALGETVPDTRPRMCGDCAYRPTSPERRGDEQVAGDAELLEQLAAAGTRFWCHDGMRQPVRWRHPAGMQIPAAPGTGDYQPPIVAGVPYRADGRPGLLCAGWAARRRTLTGRRAGE